MVRRIPRERALSRRGPRLQPNIRLLVCCEGQNTEPDYLKEFAFEWGNRLVNLVLIPGAGVPMSVVGVAVREKNRLEAEAKRSSDSFDSRFEVWAVFDIDQHPKVDQAKQIARNSGVKVAVSNPCFELWAVLHFRDHGAIIGRHPVQAMLETLMPQYNRRNAKRLDYSAMRDGYTDACRRAEALCRSRKAEGIAGGNPSTDVHKLMAVIEENGVKKLI